MPRNTFSPEQDFSTWDAKRLAKYRSDLESSPNRQDRRILMKVSSILNKKISLDVQERCAALDAFDWLTTRQKESIEITHEYIKVWTVKLRLLDESISMPFHESSQLVPSSYQWNEIMNFLADSKESKIQYNSDIVDFFRKILKMDWSQYATSTTYTDNYSFETSTIPQCYVLDFSWKRSVSSLWTKHRSDFSSVRALAL